MNDYSGIYRWKKQTNPRTYSRSQNAMRGVEDIQNWLQKVEMASERATHEVLGVGSDATHIRPRLVNEATRMVRENDENYTEAQELLEQWMADKWLRGSDNWQDVDGDGGDTASVKNYRRDVQLEWDRLLEENGEGGSISRAPRSHASHLGGVDSNWFDGEEEVDAIIDNLLKQDFVKTSPKDFIVNKSYVDPRLKMKLRQEQVKKNRLLLEQRQRKKLDEAQQRKQSQSAARRLIHKELKDKEREEKREETLIQQEMTRIRKVMREERQQEERMREERIRQERIRQEKIRQEKIHEEMVLQDLPSPPRKQEAWIGNCSDIQAKLLDENYEDIFDVGAISATNTLDIESKLRLFLKKKRIKIVRQHFAAWYGCVISQRLQLGQAAAVYDWRLTNRVWSRWRAHCRQLKLDREVAAHEQSAKDSQRKLELAKSRQRLSVLRHYFTQWQVWLSRTVVQREECENKERTRGKMLAFLQAAESRVQAVAREKEMSIEHGSVHQIPHSLSKCNDIKKTQSVTSKQSRRGSKTSTISADSDVKLRDESSLINEAVSEISHVPSNAQENGEVTSVSKNERALTSKKDFTVNNFQHRHNAQQKILQDQQRQILQQKRMIEDLQYEQNRQILEKQAEQFRLLHEKLSDRHSDVANDADGIDTPSSVLQTASASQSTLDTQRMSKQRQLASSSPKPTSQLHDFTKNMSERAAMRARRAAERQEQRKKLDAQRLEELRAQEAEMERQAQEEKMRQRKIQLEKKQLEKQKAEEKQKQNERLRSQMEAAVKHNEAATMKWVGFLPWCKLVQIRRDQRETATLHHNSSILRQSLVQWKTNVDDLCKIKNTKADSFHQHLIVRQCFIAWTKYKHHTIFEEARAERHHRTRLLRSVLLFWLDVTTDEKMRSWRNDRLAGEHHTKHLHHLLKASMFVLREYGALWPMVNNLIYHASCLYDSLLPRGSHKKRLLISRCFKFWLKYPEARKQQEEAEQRRMEMKRKVAELLPDYKIKEDLQQSDSFV